VSSISYEAAIIEVQNETTLKESGEFFSPSGGLFRASLLAV